MDEDNDDSLTNHPVIKKANSTPSSKIQNNVPLKQTVRNNAYCFYVRNASELSEPLKERIWTIFESNMKTLYETSNVFPWDPPGKRNQMFHEYSRFLLVTADSEKVNATAPDEKDLLAFSMFRFEREGGINVVYLYELQISQAARRLGLGRALIHNLNLIGRAFRMSFLMLTHLKVNDAAKAFYNSLGFETDPMSPDYNIASGCETNPELDEGYSILSRRITR